MIVLPGVTIHSQIYESAVSLVYRGIRVQDQRAVVLKMLKQDYPSPQELTRYRQEYEITRSLNLEGVVKAYSQQDYQRTLVILLEDFGGESLERWRQHPNFCPMPLSTFLRLGIKIAEILGRIHSANVIHKDINPGNIVFNQNTGVVKIIDFGIATRFNRTKTTFKSPHVLEGTLAYISPEQTGRMNRWLDYRTDFYSLGVTFYELLTGQLPFPTTDILELVHCHIAKPPVPPHELNPAIPKPVSDIILKLMAKNAEDRYQSAWGLKADLEGCSQQFAQSSQIDEVNAAPAVARRFEFVDSIQLGLQDVSEQLQIPQKLYGREAEIRTLLAAFDRVAGRGNEVNILRRPADIPLRPGASRGSCVDVVNSPFQVEITLVSGYAGIGKSALVQELYQPITEKHGYFISGKFEQFERNIPYSALKDALRKLVQQLLGEPEKQVQQWRARLLKALGNNGQIIIDAIPEVELIIGKQPTVAEVGAIEAQNRFNRVFGQFIRVFCSKEHPLVLFLDDLQWSDSATLKLIESMLLDEQTHSLFLIGAYRDHEVNPTHSLVLTLSRLREQGVVLQEIVLSPLTLLPLSQLIAETLHHNTDTVRSLAELVWQKTQGNPFFVIEFLKTLYAEDCLKFDVDCRSWQWDVAQIQAKNITDNVVVLMTNKLSKLPESVQQILQLAACVGNEFDMDTLSMICGMTERQLFSDLVIAVETGLILPTSELDENLLIQNYKFLHDRVQQAAYALIDESQKQVVHLQIGRNLLAKTTPEQLLARLFEVVDHLNQGREMITAQPERTEIARLNLTAGEKALAARAYEVALKYCRTGIKLLNPESWHSEYDLTLALYSEAAEAAYLHGCFDEMEQFVEVVLNHAQTVVDKVQVYNSRIQKHLSQGNLKSAIEIGLEVLQLLGVNLIENPSQLDVQRGLTETASLLAGREIEDLIDLPKMTATEPLAAFYILANIGAAAFFLSSDLSVLIACKMVNLSINYGNAIWSSHSYAVYGFVLCGVVQDIELGYKFGQLALRLAEQLHTPKGNTKALTITSVFLMHWKVHFRKIIPMLVEAYQEGVETGDFEFAGYAAYNACCYSFFVSEPLTELEQKTAAYSQALRQIRREIPSNWIAMLWQTILNLLGRSENPSRLMGSVYDEKQALSHTIAVKDGTGIHYFYLYTIILCYLFREYHQAAQSAVLARQYVEEIKAAMLPLFCFYHSLVLLSLWVEASSSEKAAWLSCVRTNQEKLQKWAEHAPMNYLHKFHLVEAEKARVFGQFLEAEEFYERAISGAAEHEFIQEEALAYELAAKHYLARGRLKFAQTYMKEAHYCYKRWGATAKVKDLETCYPQFFPQSFSVAPVPVHTIAGTTSNTSPIATDDKGEAATALEKGLSPFSTGGCLRADDKACGSPAGNVLENGGVDRIDPNVLFDLVAVLKASQAISREIELEQLLCSLMQILIENAGAQTGYLLLENSGAWVIEAACEFNDGEPVCAIRVQQSIPTANRLPESIIQYVIRTHESVILNDATREGIFLHDPYIQRHQTQSIFCLPLLNQAKLVGVLYLENRLAAGAFTPERAQVLNLLSTQAAIAIENARLYSKLCASESRMAQFLEAVPVGIAVVDAVGRPYYFNQQAIQLMGKGVDPAVTLEQFAETYQSYVAGTNQKYPTEEMPLFRALKGEYTRKDDLEIHRGNTIIPVEVWGTPVFDEQGNIAYAITAFQDITERKQAEQLLANYNRTLEQQIAERTAALQQSEAELRALFAAIPDPLFVLSAEGQVLEVIAVQADQLYKPIEEQVGKTLQEIFTKEQADKFLNYIHHVLSTQEMVTVEYSLWTAGQKTCFSTRIAPIGPDRVIWLARDISDRQRAEEASILEERNRMAREIHDTLAQSFSGIVFHARAASKLKLDPEKAQAHLTQVENLARTGLFEARRSVETLRRPYLLENNDLLNAFQILATQIEPATGTRILCAAIGSPYALPCEVENNLLRIGQEAITNALKYAQATEIRLELIYQSHGCRLRIKDDGRGFKIDGTFNYSGFGLLGIAERAARIGAQFQIQSNPGVGTEITVLVNQEQSLSI